VGPRYSVGMPLLPNGRGAVLRLVLGVYLAISFLDRVVLFVWSPPAKGASLLDLPAMLVVGVGFDLIAIAWLLLPAVLYALLMPAKLLASRPQKVATRVLFFLVLGLFLFNVVAGWIFWEEFAARYNFIAVDYLVYTTEVTNNIVESYPMPLILGGLLVATSLLYFGLKRQLDRRLALPVSGVYLGLVPFLIVPLIAWFFVDGSLARVSSDRYRNEITQDGIYSLCAAFRSNVLEYEDNFPSLSVNEAFAQARAELAQDGLAFVSDDPRDLRRHRASVAGEKRLNVMLIVVESLSAEYMTMFHADDKDLTPRLDALAKESLVFASTFATGSRTVRGLEALTLSVPPTPGRSIVKRPNNEGLDNIGWQFADRGYDTRFFYGGYGYFDNMNHFFSSNGFEVVDHADLAESEIRFENAWGVCDQDIFDRALKDADESAALETAFFSLVMTTSNHRPYTYPDVVPLGPGLGRDGAVQYTDFAIGEFVESAKAHDWFDDTVFIVVGDHCASSAGKRDITVAKHHIPMLFYSPAHIAPTVDERIASQIDFGPTLLGMLDFGYTSGFFGHDLLGPGEGRALLGNYQTLGLYAGDELCLLRTKKGSAAFSVGPDLGLTDTVEDPVLRERTIAIYQAAAATFESGAMCLDRDVEATRR